MSLTADQLLVKAKLEQLYYNAYLGIIGHSTIVLLLTFVLSQKVAFELIALGLVVHIIIIAIRLSSSYRFHKRGYKLEDYSKIKALLNRYRLYLVSSAFALGLIPLFIQGLSIEYHFLILSIFIFISAGAIFTIGEDLTLYAAYFLALFSVMFIWMLSQSEYVYHIGSLLISVAFIFSILVARHHANNFKKVIKERDVAQQYVFQEKKAQAEILMQKNIIDYQSKHDLLTDLPNRIFFKEKLEGF